MTASIAARPDALASALVSARALGKSFGASPVLQGIDLDLFPGEVVALLGANGAGKSTLVKVLAGSHGHDAGELRVQGRAVRFASPQAARRAGIVAVHQHVDDAVVPGLSVAENLVLDELCQPGNGVWAGRGRLRERAAQIAAGLDLHLPLDAPIESLGTAERQLVVLARALALEPRLLILDEPTASLSASEAERLFALIDRLRQRGVVILYISHRLSDLQRIADRAIVLRDGRLAGEFAAPLDLAAAVVAMLGSALAAVTLERHAPGREVLAVRGCRLDARSAPFDLSLHEGEVVALTGLLGAGKSEIAELLFGLRRAAAGHITLDGQHWAPATPRQAIAGGVFMAIEDRTRGSLVPGFSLARTLTLPFLARFSRAGFIDRRAERDAVQAQVQALGIKCAGIEVPMDTLSGGNQQKVVLARWLLGEGRVLILDEPFQGVDIRARREIGARIRASAAGRATLVICTDPDEALEIADRILVVRDGAVVGGHANDGLQRADLVAQLAGVPEHPLPDYPHRQGAARA
ncbi:MULTISPECIES: sugar ABC transporter ATP-binding protein [unclassified Pseudomonas]|uniref:sugar ABC transporter ATP-binding protein n=1 Tax=unclassified Pseudomonas TaxID=196821 RepID=UPI000DA789CE|nr:MULTISPECIES: sugar ABC transporter ATP-binding protein [unclassified Pseudomonas]MDW3716262.1 sugar ABC transporter ATP-binding protein [Pseudomonas sp. 2023EL-01195]PZE11791.1 sugar ABC transporter ATP-binding protein [Pseudomonas sp. 57B-090624]